ncbi:MAG: hypothetical protein A2Y15_07995 [Clostridiales bacterium GWF2_36_10]|nr:MAG: hypothetical protein A2Y15_07995 [Clostridiales bacterium GWF2_36_10]
MVNTLSSIFESIDTAVRLAENVSLRKNEWLPRYHRMTNRLSAYVIDKLRETRTFTSVSKEVNLSISTVIRIFNFVSYSNQSLPVVIGIDEFKGNTGRDKYQCIITDIKNGRVVDILPTRYKQYYRLDSLRTGQRNSSVYLMCKNLY